MRNVVNEYDENKLNDINQYITDMGSCYAYTTKLHGLLIR